LSNFVGFLKQLREIDPKQVIHYRIKAKYPICELPRVEWSRMPLSKFTPNKWVFLNTESVKWKLKVLNKKKTSKWSNVICQA